MEKSLKSALIVDDEPEIIDLIESAASPYVESFSRAHDAGAALDLFLKTGFDLVISDVRMPGLTGIDLFESIRKISPTSPFIIVSGALEIHHMVRAVKLGLTDVIEKPFTRADVARSIEKIISNRFNTHLENLKHLNLTTRQISVVENLLMGKSNKEISSSVGVTEQAVKYHVSQLLRQFNVYTRRDLREQIGRQIGIS